MTAHRNKFIFEIVPIEVDKTENRRKLTLIPDLGSGRIVDSYSGMPIGMVIYVANAYEKGGYGFEAHTIYPVKGDDGRLPEPKEGWGTRVDLAAKAIWEEYNSRLPLKDRIHRFLWRWTNTYLLISSAVVSALISVTITGLLSE